MAKKVCVLFVSICLVLLMFICLDGEAENSRRRVNSQLTRNEKVKEAVSIFIFALRHELPGLALSRYQPEDLLKKAPTDNAFKFINDNIKGFFNSFTTSPSRPLVYMMDSKITWEGNEAVVKCMLLWNVKNKRSKKCFSYRVREVFRLKEKQIVDDSKYVITKATTTPVVFQKLANHKEFKKEIKRAYAEGGLM
jgi:hypothetical protein